jgi:tetratricopeptide (TPR) repeat protein
MALNNLGVRLAAMGRATESLVASEESVERYRRLAHAHPTVYGEQFAEASSSLAVRLSAMGRKADALPHARAAVSVRRGSAQATPTSAPQLAMALSCLSACLMELGLWEEAAVHAREAAAVSRPLAKKAGAAPAGDLATALGILGSCLAELDRWGEALAAAEESATLYRPLAVRDAGSYELRYALSLWTSARARVGGGHDVLRALSEVTEALTILRRLAAAGPGPAEGHLRGAEETWGEALRALGSEDQEADRAQEGGDRDPEE